MHRNALVVHSHPGLEMEQKGTSMQPVVFYTNMVSPLEAQSY